MKVEKKRCLKTVLVLGGMALAVVPSELFAETTEFGAAAFSSQADAIKSFLFGPTLKVAGIMGGAYGLIQSVVTSNVRPLLTFGGIGLGASLMEKFITAVFVTGCLLP